MNSHQRRKARRRGENIGYYITDYEIPPPLNVQWRHGPYVERTITIPKSEHNYFCERCDWSTRAWVRYTGEYYDGLFQDQCDMMHDCPNK